MPVPEINVVDLSKKLESWGQKSLSALNLLSGLVLEFGNSDQALSCSCLLYVGLWF